MSLSCCPPSSMYTCHSYVSCTNKSSTLRLLRAASCCCLPRGWLLHLLETGQQQRLQRTLGFTSCCSQTERKKIFMRKIIFDEGMKIPKKKYFPTHLRALLNLFCLRPAASHCRTPRHPLRPGAGRGRNQGAHVAAVPRPRLAIARSGQLGGQGAVCEGDDKAGVHAVAEEDAGQQRHHGAAHGAGAGQGSALL